MAEETLVSLVALHGTATVIEGVLLWSSGARVVPALAGTGAGGVWVAKCCAVAMMSLGLSGWFVSRRSEAARKQAAVEVLLAMERELEGKGVGREERARQLRSQMAEINAVVRQEKLGACTAAARGALAFHAGIAVLLVHLAQDIAGPNLAHVLDVWNAVLESSDVYGPVLVGAAVYHLGLALLLLSCLAARSLRTLASAVV
mmetsp:Transcript_2123/g.7696  ORF Transcript_2123/g.7696 Transcript_2123/m.7696 type:complete len:202 (+) Transcript_2123:63-668(+)